MASLAHLPIQLDPLAELQARFGLIDLGGEVRLVDRERVQAILDGGSGGEIAYYKRGDAQLVLRRHAEMLPAPDVKRLINDFWVDPGTHMYDGVAFDPRPTPATTLNYWTPPSVQPAPGDWSIIHDFLRDIICDGDASLHAYLLHYVAHMLQKPEEKPGVMLVMMGGQGTGKGTVFELIRALWSCTTLQVADVDHVIGTFNAPLERAFAVCLDEAIFSGDRRALDRLKSLITERHITIEAKYQPRRTIESFHRFIAATNHIHWARIEADDRRFTFLRVSPARQGDHDYFRGLHAAIADPAVIAAMAYDLLAMDLSGFNVRQRPKTAEHSRQKLHSLEGFDRYWYEVLETGSFGCSGMSEEEWNPARFIGTAILKAHGERFHGAVRRTHPLTEQDIGRALRKWCPAAVSNRRTDHGRQMRGYDLPSLAVARAAFEAALGGVVDWPESMGVSDDSGEASA